MRFAILGPVRAWRGENELGLGSPQQRAVLAALLMRRGRPATVGELVDAVWGEEPPPGAVSVLRTYVSRLRKVLEPGRGAGEAPAVVVSVADGYTVQAPDDALDLGVFERRTAEARKLRAAGDLAGAGELLHAALGAWAGVPLAGIPGPLAEAERAGLGERRLSVLETRLEVDLELGHHDEVVGELTSLVGEHPLRERLCRLLMLALYRCGRQAEALAVYRETRRRLVAELGIEPGAALRELHARLLAADPALDFPDKQAPAPAAAPVPVAALRPAQLPADLPAFTGRSAELARTAALLPVSGEHPSTVVISAIGGMAGVGKTTLAVHWAHQVAHRFPDGQLYINLRGFDPTGSVMDPAEAVRAFLDALGVAPQQVPGSLDAQTALYRSLLAERHVLVVLDNARDTEQVRPLLPGSPGCLVIITSRNQLTGLIATDGAYPLTLSPLPMAEARDFLARRIGAQRLAAEPRAADDIIAGCARLPLALAIVAARAATYPTFPLAAIAEELHESHGSLDAFAGTDTATDARAVFSWSYHALSPDAARLFRLLALHPGPDISAHAAASVAGLPLRQARPLLAELTGAHLLTEHAPGRFTFHDLLRAYAAELTETLDSEAERHALSTRLLDHYLRTAHTACMLVSPHRGDISMPSTRPEAAPEALRDHKRAMNWLGTERAVLLSAVEQSAHGGFDDHTWRLAWAIEMFLDRRGHWHDQVAMHRTALASAQRGRDLEGQAHAHRALGFACGRLNRQDEADIHLPRALELFGRLGDASWQARTHRSMAFLSNGLGDHLKALDHYQEAIELYRSTDYVSGQASVYNEVGWTYILLGEHEEALVQCGKAIELHRQVGDVNGEAAAIDSLGYAHHHLGQYEQAIARYREANAFYRELGDSYLEADTLVHIGDTQAAVGDTEAACDSWRKSLAILEEFEHPDAEQVRERLRGFDPDPGQPPSR
ncbi:AfsR/SARP family transcriptional regulator [Wenjunlia tyrosinilytica]|uniref:SARP family transcriptional regulator n=1 Tax=Wenjunlia tyrosinilytica TaxID=1544741 RepID=A0A917ZUE8_9ACTN|nr:BTAD domain-containing putative transcriptional regulator [Wenjunlia tyrosinilytica]GGO95778.1 SARP family transcriptional regulator [Wenjunlia tyrosinilytica]